MSKTRKSRFSDAFEVNVVFLWLLSL
jgi:hypothetical protein